MKSYKSGWELRVTGLFDDNDNDDDDDDGDSDGDGDRSLLFLD